VPALRSAFRAATVALAAGLLVATAGLTGCGAAASSSTAASTATSTTSAATPGGISGRVHGGQPPISGANIQLYAVSSAGDGTAASSIMNNGVTVTTASDGSFSVTGDYTCPSSPTYVYILATGGNPGLGVGGSNPQIQLMVGLGLCSSIYTNPIFIDIDEVTTVATVAALLPWIASATSIGYGSADAAAFATAFNTTLNEYANINNGSSPGPALPNGSSASSTTVNTLANLIGTCVDSAGGLAGSSTACGSLFTNATPNNNTPAYDTVTALIEILSYPRHQGGSTNLFNLIGSYTPFLPMLGSQPIDWSLPIVGSSYGTASISTSSSSLVNTITVNEGTPSVSFTVNMSGNTSGASVGYAVANTGQADAGRDYIATQGTLTWAANDNTSRTVTVQLYNPGASSGTRYFQIFLNSPIGAKFNTSYEYDTATISETDTALSISSQALTVGSVGASYSAALTASGGVAPYTWSLVNGSSLPAGLSLSASGAITGMPTGSQLTNTVFQVNDSATPTSQSTTITLPVIVATTSAAASQDNQVLALPSSTQAQAIQKALLTWGVDMVAQLNANNQATAANNLQTDIANDLTATFTVPTSLPSNLYPAIPSIATNPSVTQQVSALNSLLKTDASTPPTYPVAYTSALNAATDVQNAMQMTWALLYSGQSLYLDPALVPSLLTRMENGVNALSNSSISPDFTTIATVPLEYLLLTQGWPQLVFPSRQAVWLAAITANQNTTVSGSVGTHLAAGPNDVGDNWINADVKWLEGIAYGVMITGTAQTAIIQGGLAEMNESLFFDGGTNYIETENEACEYHPIYAAELARLAQVTNNAYSLNNGAITGYTLAAGTKNYYPLSFEPGNVCEYITAPSNKKYWDESNASMGQQVATYLTGDPYNYYQMAGAGWATGFDAAAYYPTNITGQALPSSWITYDRNALGPHGVNDANGFSFQSTTRNAADPGAARGEEGVPTFVGGMLVDSTAQSTAWALNGAVERIGNTVLYAPGAELLLSNANFYDLADNQNAAQITTSTFGSVSTVFAMAGYESGPKSWTQTETWVLLPDRVIGLCSMVNSAAETAYALEGAVHFVSGRNTTGTQKTLTALSSNLYAYSVASDPLSMQWQVFSHDYANIATEYSETYSDPGYNKASNLLLNDAHNSTTATYTWPAGTSHYFFSEFRPSTSTAAGSPTVLTGLPTGLVGFTFLDEPSGVSYTIVHNPTAAAIAYTPSSSYGSTITMSGTQYRASWIDPTNTQSVPSATYAGSIPAYSHIVITP